MSGSAIAFYGIAAFVLITGLLTVTTKKLFRAAIWLLFSLIGIAALYFWMEVEFAAAVQVIVYVGGIVVLIIFSIFLTHQEGINMPSALTKRSIFAGLAVIAAAGYTCLLLLNHYWMKGSDEVFDPSVNKIGHLLVANTAESFVLPFELVSVLLLAAMIGCIVIALKAQPEKK